MDTKIAWLSPDPSNYNLFNKRQWHENDNNQGHKYYVWSYLSFIRLN